MLRIAGSQSQGVKIKKWEIVLIFAILIVGLAGVGFLTLLLALWPVLLSWPQILRLQNHLYGRVILFSCALGLGYILFLTRKRFRRLYAISELVAGALACWAGLNATHLSVFSPSIALAGGIYIIVRGLDNYEQGSILAEQKAVEEDEELEKNAEAARSRLNTTSDLAQEQHSTVQQ
jgi:hypothetical protein